MTASPFTPEQETRIREIHREERDAWRKTLPGLGVAPPADGLARIEALLGRIDARLAQTAPARSLDDVSRGGPTLNVEADNVEADRPAQLTAGQEERIAEIVFEIVRQVDVERRHRQGIERRVELAGALHHAGFPDLASRLLDDA